MKKVIGMEAMKEEAGQFVASLVPRKDRATIVTLSGDLGAGKTTFVQGVAKALGVEETVTSPTFVLEKVYDLIEQPFVRLIHIDAYRLDDPHELEVLGWHDTIADPANLILLEWPERIASLIPDNAIRITLEGSGESRNITYFIAA